MKKLIVAVIAMAFLSACSFTGGKLPDKYQSTFPGVKYADLTKFDKGGPDSTK